MDHQYWNQFKRAFTIETAQIFIIFYECVIQEKMSMKEAVDRMNKDGILRNQSRVTSIINSLNDTFEAETRYTIVSKSKTKTNNWSESKMAGILYQYCKKIISLTDRSIENFQKADANPYIHVAFSTFGMPFVKVVQNLAEEYYGGEFQFQYKTQRTRDIPNVLQQDISLDFALGESLKSDRENFDDNINRDKPENEHIESRLVWSEKITAVSNYNLCMSDEKVIDEEARKFPVKTVDQGIMLQFLANLHNITLNSDQLDKNAAQQLISSSIHLITPLYSDVHSLIESFLLEKEKAVIFAGATVAKQIESRYNFLKEDHNKLPLNLQMSHYELELDNPNYLDKRIFRRKDDEDRFNIEHPYHSFWKAAEARESIVLDKDG